MKTGPKIFSDDVTAALSAPLSRDHIKDRDQGRCSKVFYIEGWHVIAEANRIFGFDGWTRETVMSECCHSGTYDKAVWENGRKTDRTVTSFRCSYRARVRVTAGGIVREGSGHGHGFSDNPGEAHESAEKEAETDAMKRALMTFGNPFGLALYDKKMENVEPPAKSWNPLERNPQMTAQPQTARGRIYKAFDEAKIPSEIDKIIEVNGDALSRIKEAGPEGRAIYESLMAFANTRKTSMYGAA